MKGQDRKFHSVFCSVAACIFLLWGAANGWAQLPTATILGTVKDTSGAVIPGVNLTAKNVDTGQTRTAVSGPDGSYRLSAMPIGNYEVRAEHGGFESAVRRGLTLTVAQEAVVNFSMQIGAVEQTVAVTAEAPLVNTTSGALGSLVDATRVAELPLNGRNYTDLALLQAGVTQSKNAPNGTATNAGQWISVNGAPLESNNYMLDGAIVQSLEGANGGSISNTTLGIDGIQEFRVITNSFSAEYGLTMGSQWVIVSKNGTNSFHGTAFDYLRNSALDARTFFTYQTPATGDRRLPAFERNNFGGSLGGPIKKDNTFFHVVFEGVQQKLGLSELLTTIPAADRVNGALGVQQIAPQVLPLLSVYPLPNLPNNQYTYPYNEPTSERYGQARVDHTFNSKDAMFGRYTVDNDGYNAPSGTPSGYPGFVTNYASRTQYLTLSENHIFSPTLLNTFRASYSRAVLYNEGTDPYVGPQYSEVTGHPLQAIGITGISSPTLSIQHSESKQNIFTESDDLFYTRGRHSLKFGTLINHYQQFYLSTGGTSWGSITFTGLPQFLQGTPTTYSALTPGSAANLMFHFNTLGFYAQDDFRVSSRLTLNLGLRYEFITIPTEPNNTYGALQNIQHDAQFTLGPLLGRNPTTHNFSPRLGFAWDLFGDGKTALRGGFAELYDVGNYAGAWLQTVSEDLPYTVTSQLTAPPGTTLPPFTLPFFFPPGAVGQGVRPFDYYSQQPSLLTYNLTLERQLPLGIAITLAYAGSRGWHLPAEVEGNPTIPEHLPDGQEYWTGTEPRTNPYWGTLDVFTTRAESWYNAMQFGLLKRLSHGLQFQSSFTWSKDLDTSTLQLTGENGNASARAPDPNNPIIDKGPALIDIAYNWRLNTIYHFPRPASTGFVGQVLAGWWTSSILSLQSGYPFTVALGSNRSLSGVGGGAAGIDRPNVNPGRSNSNITSGTSTGCLGIPAGTPLGTPNLYYDPCAFSIQPAGFLGNVGRDTLRGPGFATLDLSVVKDTSIRALGESGMVEFRIEGFNILNRPNFGIPGRTVFAGTASVQAPTATTGVITSLVSDAREIQIALKLLF